MVLYLEDSIIRTALFREETSAGGQRRGEAPRHRRSSIDSWSIASRHTQNAWRVAGPVGTRQVHHPADPARNVVVGAVHGVAITAR
jgi:hypothetical protein